MHVPRSWCLKRCLLSGNKDVLKGNKIKPPKPMTQARSFVRAMRKWIGSGFEVVHRNEYRKRMTACKECTDKKTCPFCGCNLWAKAALKTEDCILGKW